MADISPVKSLLADSSSLQNCLDAAYRYLSYRPRSEAEIRQRLRQRSFDNEVIEKAIARLREQSLSDDFDFAQFWRESRLSSKPKSKELISKELRDKKVAVEIVEQVISGIDDEENAYKLGSSRMNAIAHLDYPGFRRRLFNYLGYRGFNYEVINRTIATLWQEKERH